MMMSEASKLISESGISSGPVLLFGPTYFKHEKYACISWSVFPFTKRKTRLLA
jgi:hypothetical protein